VQQSLRSEKRFDCGNAGPAARTDRAINLKSELRNLQSEIKKGEPEGSPFWSYSLSTI
jgi:hypothetical protein